MRLVTIRAKGTLKLRLLPISESCTVNERDFGGGACVTMLYGTSSQK